MEMNESRRRLLQAFGALGFFGGVTPWAVLDAAAASHGSGLSYGPPQPFDFDRLRRRAQALSRQSFHPTPVSYPALLDRITYDVHQKIQFRSSDALWSGSDYPFPVEFFPLGKYARKPVRIYAVAGGKARRIQYRPGLFDYGQSGLASEMPSDLGFSGFRAMNTAGEKGDWLAFQGASYFRSAGPLNQYGPSARGIAVDTAVPGRREEFPRFTEFYLAKPEGDGRRLTVFALLDGPSITGAYRIVCRKGHKGRPVLMDIHADLFQRDAVQRLGIAPMTSMYWYSETNARAGTDWRPEIHDSDGLAMWTGKGERIWRPLNDPRQVRTHTFVDHDPRGFGLLQRDRAFDHYQDDSVYYNRRPGIWVEPRGDWGAGRVALVELPTNREIDDNIVAFWISDRPAGAGAQWTLDYRLHWVAREPFPPTGARVVATYLGRPGIPGQHHKRDPLGRKFVIEFTGGPLDTMRQRFDLDAVITASRGSVSNVHVLKIMGTRRWRAEFDLHAPGKDPVGLRCFLRLGDRTLSETWLYQWLPGNYGLPR